MTETVSEKLRARLPKRINPILDEIIEESVIQITNERTPSVSVPTEDFLEFGRVQRWVDHGHAVTVAGIIANYEMPDSQAKEVLATALENNAQYLQQQPMYNRMVDNLDEEINWMTNAAKRLRGEEV